MKMRRFIRMKAAKMWCGTRCYFYFSNLGRLHVYYKESK